MYVLYVTTVFYKNDTMADSLGVVGWVFYRYIRLGVMFANIWDVSNAAMRRHDISGLWKLSCLTSVIALLPLLLISLLPSNPEEQEKLAKSPVS